jgi:hypothetical protein
MLKRGNEGPLAGRKGDKKVALRCNALDMYRTGYSQRNPREPQEPFDAALELEGIDLGADTTDLLDLVTGRLQSLPARNQRLK